MDMYTLQYLKWVTNKELLVQHRKLCSMSMTAWMEGKYRGDGMQVYSWLSLFAVSLKVSHFKSVLCYILCLVAQSCLTLESPWTVAHQAPPSMGILQATILEWVAMPSSRGSSQPRNWIRCPVLQADSLPSQPPGEPKNTGADSLSLLQGIFPSQELNWDLLCCRWILYQLSYQGSP